jgi:hypothetical protein
VLRRLLRISREYLLLSWQVAQRGLWQNSIN